MNSQLKLSSTIVGLVNQNPGSECPSGADLKLIWERIGVGEFRVDVFSVFQIRGKRVWVWDSREWGPSWKRVTEIKVIIDRVDLSSIRVWLSDEVVSLESPSLSTLQSPRVISLLPEHFLNVEVAVLELARHFSLEDWKARHSSKVRISASCLCSDVESEGRAW